MPSLDSLTFDTSGLRFNHEEAGRKVWFTPEGDGISLYFFNKPPDLPRPIASVQELRDFYLSMLKNGPAKLVELGITRVAGCPAIRLIIKSPKEKFGKTYLGSITMPFQDFSYVVKVQCEERGVTGLREAILFDKMHKDGTISIDSAGQISGPWNPDSTEHDASFPQHPLSRLRKLLSRIETTAVIDDTAKNEPGFQLPTGDRPGVADST